MLGNLRPLGRRLAAVILCIVVWSAFAALSAVAAVGGGITLDPPHGPVQTKVTVTSNEFGTCLGSGGSSPPASSPPPATVYFLWNGASGVIPDATVQRYGYVSTTFTVPSDAVPGDYDVTATCSSDTTLSSSARFTVDATSNPVLQLDPQKGESGTEVTASGTGFPCASGASGASDVDVYWDGEQRAHGMTDASAFSVKFTVPGGANTGPHTVRAVCRYRTDVVAEQRFTVPTPPPTTPVPTPTTTTPVPPAPIVHPGATIPVSGVSSACAQGSVDLSLDGTKVADAGVDASGRFSGQIPVPPDASPGRHQVGASCAGKPTEIGSTAFDVLKPHHGGWPWPWGGVLGGALLAAGLAALVLTSRRGPRRAHQRVKVRPKAGGPAWVEVRETGASAGGERTHTVRLDPHPDPGTQTVTEVDDDGGHAR